MIENDPWQKPRSKFLLKRASAHADYELRIQEWRVFYRVEEERGMAVKSRITLIGEKRGNRLMIGGEEFTL